MSSLKVFGSYAFMAAAFTFKELLHHLAAFTLQLSTGPERSPTDGRSAIRCANNCHSFPDHQMRL